MICHSCWVAYKTALQALAWANAESRYKTISEHTTGVAFFGTPHRGSEKAVYGRVLVNVATNVMRRPTSRLISALQTNCDQLMRLTSEFEAQLPKYQVVSFYECKPMKIFSSLASQAIKCTPASSFSGLTNLLCRLLRSARLCWELAGKIRSPLMPIIEPCAGSNPETTRYTRSSSRGYVGC